MNLTALKQRLARYTGNSEVSDDRAFDAWSSDALNQAQEEVARELRVPRHLVSLTLSANNNDVTLPTGAATNGLLLVADITNKKVLPILYPEKAVSKMPDYLTSSPSVPRFVLYAPFAPGTFSVYPAPNADITLRVIYASTPTQLVNEQDQPWNGQWPEFHDLIALRAALLTFEADWGDKDRVVWVKRRYDEQFELAVEQIAPGRPPHSYSPGEVQFGNDVTAAKR